MAEERSADPVKPRRGHLFTDTRFGEHAAVAHQHDLRESETPPQLVHLSPQGPGVGGVAFKDFHRHRTALAVAQQPELDLKLAALAVAGMAVPGQRAAAPFQIHRGEVVEHQGTVSKVSLGQVLLHLLLPLQQPVHGRVQLILRGLPQSQGLRQRVPRGGLGQSSGRGQLRHRPQDTGRNQRHDSFAFRTGTSREHAVEPQLAQGAEHGGDMAVGLGADDVEGVGGAEQGFVLEESAESIDLGLRPVGEVGDGAFADALAFTPAFAQQDGGRELRLGTISTYMATTLAYHAANNKCYLAFTWEHLYAPKHPFPLAYSTLNSK